MPRKHPPRTTAPGDGPGPATTGPLRIRKYSNRRLYDQTRSCAVRQDELCDLVAAGFDLEVTDSTTGQDITNLVLAQAIIERDPLKLAAFPPAMLHLLIRTNEQLLRGFFARYFVGLTESFLAMKRQIDGLQPTGETAFPTTPFDWAMAAFRAATGPPAAPTPGPAPSPTPSGPSTDALENLEAEVQNLREQLAALRRADESMDQGRVGDA